MKIPEPTNTASAPSCMTRAASAGVAIPPAQNSGTGSLPVVTFVAGGIATPADAALVMQMGSEGVFVGSGIFKSDNPAKRAAAIVKATTHFRDAKLIAEVSRGLGEPMRGINVASIPERELLTVRGV